MADKEIQLPEGIDIDTAVDVLREYAQTENAQIVNNEEVEALQTNLDELLDVFRSDLQERKDLAEATVEGMSVDALTAEYRNDEGEIEFETLTQNPETGDPGETGSTELDNLSREEQQELETLESRVEKWQKHGNDAAAERLEERIAELKGD